MRARVFPLAGGAKPMKWNDQAVSGHHEHAANQVSSASSLEQFVQGKESVEMWFRLFVDGKLFSFMTDSHMTLQQVHECLFPNLPVGSLFCNGKIVSHDARCESYANSVIVSRFFPLKGGGGGKNGKGEGKGKQTNTARATDFLIECLEKRGVAKSECPERAKKVVSVVGVDFILKHMEADDFWFHMKNEASKNMVRLILPQELKAWQQAKRAETKSNKSKAPSKGPAPALNPKDLQLRIADFKAEGKPMQAINEEGIKPDCTGVCLMAPSSAKNFAGQTIDSRWVGHCDPWSVVSQ